MQCRVRIRIRVVWLCMLLSVDSGEGGCAPRGWWDHHTRPSQVAPLPDRLWKRGLEDRQRKHDLYRLSLRLEAAESLRLMEAAITADVSGSNVEASVGGCGFGGGTSLCVS